MAFGGETGRLVTEVLVGIVTAIVALGLFLPVALEWKLIAIAVLVLEGALLLISQFHVGRSLGWSLRRHLIVERKIKRYPEFVTELRRLNRKIWGVLYERTSSQPSLRLQGFETAAALNPEGQPSPLVIEFQEKVEMLNTLLADRHRQIEQERRRYRWKTMEFVEVLREFSRHLEQVNKAFDTIYRLALPFRKRDDVPASAWNAWESFRVEYNSVLRDWKALTERFDQTIGYGTTTRAEPARQLQ